MSTTPPRPTGKQKKPFWQFLHHQIFRFLHVVMNAFPSGPSSHRKFTSPTSQHETSTETTWTVFGGSATWFCPRWRNKHVDLNSRPVSLLVLFIFMFGLSAVLRERHRLLETGKDGGRHRPHQTQRVERDDSGTLRLQPVWHLVHALLHGLLAEGDVISSSSGLWLKECLMFVIWSWTCCSDPVLVLILGSPVLLVHRCWLWGTRWGSCMCGTLKWKILTKQSKSVTGGDRQLKFSKIWM